MIVVAKERDYKNIIVATRMTAQPKPTLGTMDPFDPDTDSWPAYSERLEQFFVANDIADGKKVAVLLTVIGTKAYTLLRNIIAPDKPASKEYGALVEALRAHLDPKPIVIAERFKFHQRNQREGESVAQYIAELRKLSTHCEFQDYLDQAIRDRLVCGLSSEAIQKRLLSEKTLTLAAAQEIALGMEAAAKEATELQVSSKSSLEINKVTVDTAKPCFRCARKGHTPENCYFKTQKCRNCGKQGHTYKVCRAPPRGSSQPMGRNPYKEDQPKSQNYVGESEDQPFGLFTVKDKANSSILVDLSIDGTPITMTLDTGASVSIISEKTHQTRLPNLQLSSSELLLRTYTGEPIKICGQTQVSVTYKDQQYNLQLVVVEGNGPPLLGRDWLKVIKLDWREINVVTTNLDSLLQQYRPLFKDELGTMVGVKAKLLVKQDAVPKFCRARAAPYALRGAIEKDINRLLMLGVLEKVQYSDWATPVVPVPKSDGSVRLCGDFKITINPVLQIDQHPLPKPEDLLATLAGGKKFSKIDLSQAYQQMVLEPDHRKYTTINTHLGLFQYTRLPFGIASAPAVFQQQMEKILQGIPNTTCYLDDVLITGCDDKEHLETLQKVLE